MDNGTGIVRKYGRRTSSSIANCQNPRVMPGSESRSERRLSRRLRARGRVYREVVGDCVHYGGLPCTHQPLPTDIGNVSAQRRLVHTEHRCYKWPRHRYISSFRFLVSMRTRKLFQPVRIDLRANGRRNRIHYCPSKASFARRQRLKSGFGLTWLRSLDRQSIFPVPSEIDTRIWKLSQLLQFPLGGFSLGDFSSDFFFRYKITVTKLFRRTIINFLNLPLFK